MINASNYTANTSSNGSCSDIPLPHSDYFDLTKWIALTEMVGIICINLVVIVLLARQEKSTRMAFFVQHLAVADLSVGVLYVLPECVFDRFLKNWEKYSCLILYGFCANLTILASTFLIVVLTIDRMFVIVWPLVASTRGLYYRYGLVSGAWGFALIFSLPYAYHAEFSCRQGEHLCRHNFGKAIYGVVIAEVVVNMFIPVCIITVSYVCMIWVIWRRERGFPGLKQQKDNDDHNQLDRITCTQSGAISSAKTKTIKLLFVIVLVYIISWTPVNVAQVMNTFDLMKVGDGFAILHVLAPINSLMNPLVFLVFNRQMFQRKRRGYVDWTMCDHI